MRVLLALMMVIVGFNSMPARAEEPGLTLSLGSEPQHLTAAELLARPDAATLEVPADVAYGRPMTYRAVPLLGLLGDLRSTPRIRSRPPPPTASSRRSRSRW